MIGSFIGGPIGGAGSFQSVANPAVKVEDDGWYVGAPVGGITNVGASGNTDVLAVTLDDVTLVATGTLALAGQATVTLDDVTLTATGTLALSGSAAIVLDDATLEATAVTEIHGNLGTVLDDVTLVATAHVAARVLAHIRSGGYAHAPCNDGHGMTRLRASGGRR